MALLLRAPAKVNLSLRILGQREDGNHDLETIFHGLDLHDRIYARLAPSGMQLDMRSRATSGMTVTAGEDNLVLRACRKFFEIHRSNRGVQFFLDKVIPAGAGLGGGSSDAAAALILANELHGRPVGSEALTDLARSLGADVSYFLSAGTQIGEGLGEILNPVPHPGGAEFILILPPFGCSTAEVYKNYKPNLICDLPPSTMRSGEGDSPIGRALAGEFGNDLESSAMNLYPELAEIRRSVAAMGFPSVTMSGSGSTLFLMFGTHAEEQILGALKALEPLSQRGVQLMRTKSAGKVVGGRIPARVSWPFEDEAG